MKDFHLILNIFDRFASHFSRFAPLKRLLMDAICTVIVGGCVWDWFLLANSKLKFIEIEKEFKNIRKKESSYNEKMETKSSNAKKIIIIFFI